MTADAASHRATRLGIAAILLGVVCISVNDMAMKRLSGGYPLHQLVFIRSIVGLAVSVALLHLEGGWNLLRTDRPGLHALRAALVFLANMSFFAALAALPLATATAVFFIAPLFTTLLSVPILGERVGTRRLVAVGVGFLGVLAMMAPGADLGGAPRWALALPVVAALAYATMQLLTRKLGARSRASALTIYIQVMFLVITALVYFVAGDGRFAEGITDPSLLFVLRAWVWPAPQDWGLLVLIGVLAGFVGYTLSQAYRLAEAATVAPFEYAALPLAIFWGWLIFGELPGLNTLTGIALIGGAGLYVFLGAGRWTKVPAGPENRS